MTARRPVQKFVQVAAPFVHNTSGYTDSTSPPPPRAQPPPSPSVSPVSRRPATLRSNPTLPTQMIFAAFVVSLLTVVRLCASSPCPGDEGQISRAGSGQPLTQHCLIHGLIPSSALHGREKLLRARGGTPIFAPPMGPRGGLTRPIHRLLIRTNARDSRSHRWDPLLLSLKARGRRGVPRTPTLPYPPPGRRSRTAKLFD